MCALGVDVSPLKSSAVMKAKVYANVRKGCETALSNASQRNRPQCLPPSTVPTSLLIDEFPTSGELLYVGTEQGLGTGRQLERTVTLPLWQGLQQLAPIVLAKEGNRRGKAGIDNFEGRTWGNYTKSELDLRCSAGLSSKMLHQV